MLFSQGYLFSIKCCYQRGPWKKKINNNNNIIGDELLLNFGAKTRTQTRTQSLFLNT